MGHRRPLRHSPIDPTRTYHLPGAFGESEISGPLDAISGELRSRLLHGHADHLLSEARDPVSQELIHRQREELIHELYGRSLQRIRELRAAIVSVAEREYADWFDPAITERMPEGRRLVAGYWQQGVGITYSDAQLADADFQEDHPWSAAFVSYVMRTAGAGVDFRYAASHYRYLREAIDNRIHRMPSICKAYRLSEQVVEAGDIVVRARGGSGATYDNPYGTNGKTHGDIVTRVDAATIRTIGGNVNQNVDAKTLTIDATNHLPHPGYFAIIKWMPLYPDWL